VPCKYGWLYGLLLLLGSAATYTAAASNTDRVVVAGGGLTETLYALGVADHIVGVDATSTYPEAAKRKPQIGYIRTLSAGGILSLSPTLLLTTDEAGPRHTLDQVRTAGVETLVLPAPRSANDVADNIRALAKLFDRQHKGRQLTEKLMDAINETERKVRHHSRKPRVLFVLAATSQLLAAGQNTAADTVIRLAGGENVTRYQGYKPLTPEAAVKLDPQVILTADFVVKAAGGKQALLSKPALALTSAGENGRLIVMDAERLLGFGPRLGQAVADLSSRLYPDRQDSATE